MKKKVVGIISGVGVSVMIIALACVTGTKADVTEKPILDETNNECSLELETDSMAEGDYEVIAANALALTEDEQEEVIEEMVEDIPEEQIEEFEDMTVTELKEDLEELDEEYEVGEPFSEEDQNKLLYAYETYGPGALGETSDDGLRPVSYCWNSYNIGNTKKSKGVKIGYSGKLKTYAKLEGGKYYTDVDVTVYSGKSKLKSAKWRTRHTAYGTLGTNGSSVSLGIVYNGSIASSEYKKSFGFEKTKTYSALLPVYLKTWGILDVKTTEGEFNMQTTVKTSWE